MNHYGVVSPPSSSPIVQTHQDNLMPVEYDVRAMLALSCCLAEQRAIAAATPYGRVMADPAEFIRWLQDQKFMPFVSDIQIRRLSPKE
jgi:hypothetical protein